MIDPTARSANVQELLILKFDGGPAVIGRLNFGLLGKRQCRAKQTRNCHCQYSLLHGSPLVVDYRLSGGGRVPN
jgi:hypothetical protein